MRFSLFFLFTIVLFAAPPVWFGTLKPKQSYEIIGYGEAGTAEEAKKRAYDDIAGAIATKVESEFSSVSHVSSGTLQKSVDKKISQSASARLSGVKLLKSEQIEGRYYTAYIYENLPFAQKLIKKLPLLAENHKQNSYLKATPLVKMLNKLTPHTHNLKLNRKDGLWYFGAGENIELLDKKSFEMLFGSVTNSDIEMECSRKEYLMDGEEFYFTIKSTDSGYISLIAVYENGIVAVLDKNVKVDKQKAVQIPKKEDDYLFEAGLSKEETETFDLYVTIWSKKPLFLDQFAAADEELIENERYKNFDQLIEFLDDKRFSALKMTTKPR